MRQKQIGPRWRNMNRFARNARWTRVAKYATSFCGRSSAVSERLSTLVAERSNWPGGRKLPGDPPERGGDWRPLRKLPDGDEGRRSGGCGDGGRRMGCGDGGRCMDEIARCLPCVFSVPQARLFQLRVGASWAGPRRTLRLSGVTNRGERLQSSVFSSFFVDEMPKCVT